MSKSKEKSQIWKGKNLEKQRRIKHLNGKIKQLVKSRQKWRSKYYEAKKAQKPERLKHHGYSLNLMLLSVILHIQFNASLRSCSATLYHVAALYGEKIKRASVSTIRSWSIRLGYYYLQMRLTSGSYVLIIDESIMIGSQKLLLLLAIKQEALSESEPLKMRDANVIYLQASNSWKGADISKIIEEKKQEIGIEFKYCISDKGTNLRNALAICHIPWVEDCTHMLANEAKKVFYKDPIFNGFIQQQQLTRAKWSLSKHAPYLPPNLRKKARFHQVFSIYKWAERIIAHWDKLPHEVRKELCYVQENKQLIAILKQLHQILEEFSRIFKAKGVSLHTQTLWQDKAVDMKIEWIEKQQEIPSQITQFLDAIQQYLTQTINKVANQQQILCCSDVIESMFGKYKNQVAHQIISQDAVKIAAFGKNISKQDIQQAMACIDHQFLKKQQNQNNTLSLAKLKREALPKIAA